VVHEGQGLALGLEARHDLARVHAELDELDGHAPLHGRRLLGQVDDPHAAFAQLLEHAIWADALRRRLRGLVARGAGPRWQPVPLVFVLLASHVRPSARN